MSIYTEHATIERQEAFADSIREARRWENEVSIAKRPTVEQLREKPNPPYSSEFETDCEACGGTGFHDGDLFDGQYCEICTGGKITVIRRWLDEGLRIGKSESSMRPEREHVIALTARLKEYGDQITLLSGKEAA
jgi:hypothetical protein